MRPSSGWSCRRLVASHAPDRADSLATVIVIATSRSNQYSVPAAGFFYI